MNERNGRLQIELEATGFAQGALPLKRIWAKPSNLELDVKAAETCKLTAEDRAEADADLREQEESMRHVQRLQEIRAIQRRNVQEGIVSTPTQPAAPSLASGFVMCQAFCGSFRGLLVYYAFAVIPYRIGLK